MLSATGFGGCTSSVDHEKDVQHFVPELVASLNTADDFL
jgi:hypothetical protein